LHRFFETVLISAGIAAIYFDTVLGMED